jgi:hypothetical protein
MNKTTLIAAILILAAFVAPQRAVAQTALGDDVRNQIQRNEESLRIARDLVAQTNSVKARAILQSGVNLQEECKRVFALSEENFRQGHELMARQMMNKARDLAGAAREATLRAITVAKREAMTEENAGKSIEQARERYERTMILMNESSGPEVATARKLLEESREQLDGARQNLREHMYDVSLRLANLSISLSTRAATMLRRQAGSKDMAAGELQKVERLIARIEEQHNVRAYPEVEKSYREVLQLRDRAAESLRGDQFRAALAYATRARNRALRTLRMLSLKSNRENAERAIDLTGQLLDTAFDLAGSSGADAALRRLEEARGMQEKARESFSREDFQGALELTRRARNMIQETVNTMESPLSTEGVEAALRSTDTALERARNTDGVAGDQAARELLQEAEKHQDKAWESFHQSLLRMALTHTKLARNLVNEALERVQP